jgi:LmbE family N-acetylglucosaminyl deacetylase
MNKCDIIVFAPHPDDEALGCASLILENVQKGKMVKVVIITNGDGDENGCKQLFGENPTPDNYIDMGYIRQNETKAAMEILGLSLENIIFLGYPDSRGALQEIFKTDKYDDDKPFRSEFTNFTHTSYKNSYSKNVPYCRESFVRDIKRLLKECPPKRAYITHPNDRHPDHSAVGEILSEILKKYDKRVKVFGYYISMAKRPTAKGALFYRATLKMKEKRLKGEIAETKLKCLQQYKCQIELLGKNFINHHSRVERFWKI